MSDVTIRCDTAHCGKELGTATYNGEALFLERRYRGRARSQLRPAQNVLSLEMDEAGELVGELVHLPGSDDVQWVPARLRTVRGVGDYPAELEVWCKDHGSGTVRTADLVALLEESAGAGISMNLRTPCTGITSS